MNRVNPLAFLLGYFLGENTKPQEIDYNKVNIEELEDILKEARFAQNPEQYNWTKPENKAKIDKVFEKYTKSNPSNTTIEAFKILDKVSSKNHITVDDWLTITKKILE